MLEERVFTLIILSYIMVEEQNLVASVKNLPQLCTLSESKRPSRCPTAPQQSLSRSFDGTESSQCDQEESNWQASQMGTSYWGKELLGHAQQLGQTRKAAYH